MQHDADVIVVGAGLAGAAAALTLSPTLDVHVLEKAEVPATGASGAAAGLVNPFMGRRARPVWRLREALNAVSTILERADAPGLFPPQGVLRPVVEDNQEAPFREAAREHPELATWLSPAAARDRFPDVRTSTGGFYVPEGGAIDVTAMVEALLAAAQAHGATVETGAPVVYWREMPGAAVVEVGRGPDGTEELRADRVLLALGQGYPRFPELRRLGLQGVKGQTVRVRRPDTLQGPLCPLSGRGYVVPDGDTLVLGSNYDNNFDDLTPDPDASAYICEKTARMVPGVDETEILEVRAGVRVKHTDTNLPLLGPMPRRRRLWTFTALGSKGLLTAPLLALDLPEYFQDPSTIPDAVHPTNP
jgi:glycine oxidase